MTNNNYRCIGQDNINHEYNLCLEKSSRLCFATPYTIYTGAGNIIKKRVKKNPIDENFENNYECEAPLKVSSEVEIIKSIEVENLLIGYSNG